MSDEYVHFDSTLPESKTGKYGFREIKEMFYDKHLSNFEIKAVFNIMDRNKGNLFILDNIIDDVEWSEYYERYLVPFQTADTDTDFYLSKEQMLDEFTSNHINFR